MTITALAMPPVVATHTIAEPGPPFPEQWLCFWPHLSGCDAHAPVDVLDVFSGPKFQLTRSCVAHGLNAISIEKKNDELIENVLTPEGQQFFLQGLRRLHASSKKSLLWLGPPCNSWIRSSQGYYHRTEEQPGGKPAMYPQVIYWNQVADFCACAILAATSLGIAIVLEQPMNSLMIKYTAHAKQINSAASAMVPSMQHPCSTHSQRGQSH